MGYVGQAPAAKVLTSADITDDTIVNADIKSDAAIALSKTALVGGTGLTLSTNTLNVDAAQTGITSVGTIATGTWEGTTIAVGQGGTGATSLSNLITLATHTTGDYVQNITAGTGLTSTGATSGENIAHSLSVDASQTGITSVGTIGTGTWQGTAIATSYIADNSITLAKMAGGTDGNIISYDASGDPVAIATGNDGQVLTSAGANNPPAFEDVSGGVTLSGTTNNTIATVTGADALIGEANLTFDGQRLYLNESSNANMTYGLTINQASYDDAAFALKSSDVAHGVTGGWSMYGGPRPHETDDWFTIRKVAGAYGGALMTGLAENHANVSAPLTFSSIGGIATTAKTSSYEGMVNFMMAMHDDANGDTNVPTNGNIFSLRPLIGGSFKAVWLIDAEGDYFYDGADGGAFDAFDDLDALRSFSIAVSDPAQIVRNEFDDFLKTNEDDLVKMRVLGDTVANGGLINGAQLQRLHTGAIGQLSNKHFNLAEEVSDLKKQLKALTEAK